MKVIQTLTSNESIVLLVDTTWDGHSSWNDLPLLAPHNEPVGGRLTVKPPQAYK